jgi:hypothetical protein
MIEFPARRARNLNTSPAPDNRKNITSGSEATNDIRLSSFAVRIRATDGPHFGISRIDNAEWVERVFMSDFRSGSPLALDRDRPLGCFHLKRLTSIPGSISLRSLWLASDQYLD